MRGCKKIFHANGNQKKAGVAILISDKIDFKINTVTRDIEKAKLMVFTYAWMECGGDGEKGMKS